MSEQVYQFVRHTGWRDRFVLPMLGVVFLLMSTILLQGQVQYVVSPDGNDRNPGTREQPFATITRARDAIRHRKNNDNFDGPVEVILREGTYRIDEPIIFAPEDSGTADAPITYRAADDERPVISGGRPIRNWEKDGNLYRTTVSEVAEGELYFRQLFVGGARATRARTPNKFYLRTAGPIRPLGNRQEARGDKSTKNGFRFREGDISRWDDLDDVTVELYHSWTSSLHWIKNLNLDRRIIRFTNYCNWPVGYWETYQRYRIGNYFEALDTPGEWYLDRDDGVLYYWPREDENLDRAEVIAPVVTNLMEFRGHPEQGRFVRHLRFEGLTFRYQDWFFKKNQKVDGQAHSWNKTAAIQATGLQRTTFRNCEVAHTGTHAIWLGKGCKHNRVVRCLIHDTGGGGVYVGEPGKVGYMPENDRVKVERNVVENNFIHHTSHRLGGSIGIWVGSSSHNRIRHNEISDFDYTGISVGWDWSQNEEIFQRGNIIEYNHVHHNVGEILSDNGGIYVLGHSPGSVIRKNAVHHIRHYPHINSSRGLYLDGHTSQYTVENNLVYDIRGEGALIKGDKNTIQNNIFAFCGATGLRRLAKTSNGSVTIRRNIFVQKEGMMINGICKPERFARIDHNLYHAMGNHKPIFHDGSWQLLEDVPKSGPVNVDRWREMGHDAHSLVADPGFANIRERNFQLPEDSPADRIDFERFLYDKAGLQGDAEWVNKPDTIEREPHQFAPPPPKPPISYDFETFKPGTVPLVRGRLHQGGETRIEVTDESSAAGKHALKFRDGSSDKNWFPHWSIRLDPEPLNRVQFSCDLLNSSASPARIHLAFRDWSGRSYHSGPLLRVLENGSVKVNGESVATMAPGTWTRVKVTFNTDTKNTFTLHIGEPGGSMKTARDLPFRDEQFNKATWFGITSPGEKKATFYVDNLKLE